MDILIIIVIIIGVVIYTNNNKKKKRFYYRQYNYPKSQSFETIPAENESEKENDRIKKLLATNLEPCSLMNKSEFRTFQALNNLLNSKHQNQGYRLFSQVSLGGFIQVNNNGGYQNWTKIEKDAFWAFNSLRADFLIIDIYGKPVLVIEYQGKGHRVNNSSDRDIRKRYACQRAGIELIEVLERFEETDAGKVSLILNNYCEKIRMN